MIELEANVKRDAVGFNDLAWSFLLSELIWEGLKSWFEPRDNKEELMKQIDHDLQEVCHHSLTDHGNMLCDPQPFLDALQNFAICKGVPTLRQLLGNYSN